jgi:hypothetical protein
VQIWPGGQQIGAPVTLLQTRSGVQQSPFTQVVFAGQQTGLPAGSFPQNGCPVVQKHCPLMQTVPAGQQKGPPAAVAQACGFGQHLPFTQTASVPQQVPPQTGVPSGQTHRPS